MQVVLTVLFTTFRESIRNRILLGICLLAVGFIFSALLLAELALDQRVRVLTDWGLFCVSIFGILLSITIGVSLLNKEIKRKSLYVVLSRPILRWQYLVGKFLGLSLTLLIEVGLLSLSLVLLLAVEGISPTWLLFKALLAAWLEILLVAGVALFFSSFTSPYLSGLFTMAVWVVGRSLEPLQQMLEKSSSLLSDLAQAGLFLLPHLSDFNLSNRVVHELDIPWSDMVWLSLYGTGYLIVLLMLSSLIFSRRDFT